MVCSTKYISVKFNTMKKKKGNKVPVWQLSSRVSTIISSDQISSTSIFCRLHEQCSHRPSTQGITEWDPNLVRLAPNGTNVGFLKISFNTFWQKSPDIPALR